MGGRGQTGRTEGIGTEGLQHDGCPATVGHLCCRHYARCNGTIPGHVWEEILSSLWVGWTPGVAGVPGASTILIDWAKRK